MRVSYKTLPVKSPHPAFPTETYKWAPILNVALVYRHAKSRRLEAIVDSGSDRCFFHGSIGEALGVQVSQGIPGKLGGVIQSASPADVFYHRIKVAVLTEIIDLTAGFCYDLPVAGILGRTGFFDQFIITFDPAAQPPGMDIERVGRM